MANTPEEHKKEILDPFQKKFAEKYDRGVEEHGGGLYHKPLSKMMDWGYDEILDFVCYYSTIQQHLDQILDFAQDGFNLNIDPQEACAYIINIFESGNKFGTKVEGD